MISRGQAAQEALCAAEHERVRIFLLQVMKQAGLEVEDTVRELQARAHPTLWPTVESYVKATYVTGVHTILDLLHAIHPGMEDFRQDERVDVQGRCRVTTFAAGPSIDGFLCELSRNGCRLEGDFTLTSGAELTLYLWLPQEADTITVDRAVVRWVRGRQVGVEFLDLRGDAAARVLRHIEKGRRRPQ